MENLRYKITQKNIDYWLTFEQVNEVKRNHGYWLADLFDKLPYKEKLLVRPDWQPPPDEPFYPDVEYE